MNKRNLVALLLAGKLLTGCASTGNVFNESMYKGDRQSVDKKLELMYTQQKNAVRNYAEVAEDTVTNGIVGIRYGEGKPIESGLLGVHNGMQWERTKDYNEGVIMFGVNAAETIYIIDKATEKSDGGQPGTEETTKPTDPNPQPGGGDSMGGGGNPGGGGDTIPGGTDTGLPGDGPSTTPITW